MHAVDIDTDLSAWGAFKGLFSNLPYNVARFLSYDFSVLLQTLVQNETFDLVQLEGSYLSLYVDAIRAVSNVPIVLRSHNVEFQIWDRLAAHEPNLLKRIYIKRLARQIRQFELAHLHDYDAIIPIAGHDEVFYRAEGYRLPIRTINGGVDLQAFAPQKPLEANLKVGFLGSLEWMPNVQGLTWFLEDIWPQVHKAFPALELHVAGKNPPAYLSELRVPGMTFHGMVPDAAAFMESCHFFIVPLHSGGGMRLKVVEAMAMGRCVIATPVGAEGVDAQADTEIILAESVADWVKAFSALVPAPVRSLAIAQRAHAVAQERFSLDAVGAQLEGFYKEVLA